MNHPEEIYGRLNWMFPDQYSSKWRDWNDRFLEYVESGYGKVLIGPKPERLDEMRQELGVFTVYRRKLDELDLPPKTEQTLRVQLSPKQRAAYRELQDSLVATLDTGEQVVGLQPVVLLTRLRQVATGLDLVSRSISDSSKIDLACELVADNPDDPFVIFSWFKEAANVCADRLRASGEVVHLVTGDTPQRDRAGAIQAFQGGHGRVFVGTISTLGESVNLHRASQAIFLDRSWNPAQNEQAADRIYRIGQSRPVTITYLVAADTVDELKVLPVLNTKEQIRRMILGGL
jgi:SNF2 family DNA or RNA helicase